MTPISSTVDPDPDQSSDHDPAAMLKRLEDAGLATVIRQ
jgi:hypothetical protein